MVYNKNMNFCPNCHNYISVKFESQDYKFKVIHKCKNCEYVEDMTNKLKEDSCMYYNPNEIDKLQYYIKQKEYLRYDPTIPHTDIIPCPNESCPSKDQNIRNDVIYINLDDEKLYILYICNHCQSHWSNNN